jgi:hypothetical protein
MPNWCQNNLSIYGKKEDMMKFIEVISINEDEYALLEKLYPTPEELLIGNVSMSPDEQQLKNEEKFGYKSWYDWRIDKWGTKWTESELQIGQELTHYDSGNSAIAFNFESAWSPPVEAFDKISMDYPNLLFCLYYEEPGMCFCGKNVWVNGESIESVQAELVSDYFDEEYLYEEYIANK